MVRISLLLTISLTLTMCSLFGQGDKDKIIASFDKVEYYPDSMIKCAYKLKKGLYHGYAIEFDSSGTAFKIGKYKKGKKEGSWSYRSGAREGYKNGENFGLISFPGCGTGEVIAKEDFQKLYLQLIQGGK